MRVRHWRARLPARPKGLVLRERQAQVGRQGAHAGAEAGLRSVGHGAGRRMTRSEARAKLSDKYRRTQLERTTLGGRVVCDDKALLFEEHPDAYKAIEPVIQALETHGMATRVAALTPVFTVKL